MLPDLFKHFFDALKLAPKYLVAISLVLGFLLFAPAEWLQGLSVTDLAKNYRQWFGIAFLASTVLVGVGLVQWCYSLGAKKVAERRFKRKVCERLTRLTEDEMQILRFYINHQTRTNTLRTDDGVVQGLVSAGIIYRAASIGNLVEGFAYNISDIAWDVLNKEQRFLIGITDIERTDKRSHWMA